MLSKLKKALDETSKTPVTSVARFFKVGTGHYAEHDQFLGISVPQLRTIAKQFPNLLLAEIRELLYSPFNEERLLALFILVNQYKKGDSLTKERIYQFYCDNLNQVNNWNLVDSCAHLIVGAHLHADAAKKDILITLAQSTNIWHRRIGIIATWYFIKQHEYEWTLTMAQYLLNDTHDLIHKAVGWMLREVGEKDLQQLKKFLDQHAQKMPRTMLRYAIEKLPEQERKQYLVK